MRLHSLLSLFFLCFLAFSCEKKKASPEVKPVPVTVLKVQPRKVPAVFEYVAVAQSSHQVEIRARVEGYLQSINFIEGSFVKEGQLLYQIDPLPFKAALDSAVGELERQKALLWNAETTKNRLEPLYKQNAISKRDLDNAISDVAATQASVDSAAARVQESAINLGYTTINAPISGLIGESQFREGALLTPGPSGLLTRLSIVNPIWINFNVSENEILKFQDLIEKKLLVAPKDMGFTVQAVLANGSTFPEKGVVSFANPVLDQRTGTMLVRAVFPNPKADIKPGQFIRVKVEGAYYPNAITVPQKAVMQGQKGMFVYIVDKENIARMQPVDPGSWSGDDWIINSGLKAGDIVVIEGVNKIQPGRQVIPKQKV